VSSGSRHVGRLGRDSRESVAAFRRRNATRIRDERGHRGAQPLVPGITGDVDHGLHHISAMAHSIEATDDSSDDWACNYSINPP